MGIFNKQKVNSVKATENIEVEGQEGEVFADAQDGQESPLADEEENKIERNDKVKKQYIYLGLRGGEIFIDSDGKPVISNITENATGELDKVDWPKSVELYVPGLKSDRDHRIELETPDKKLSKEEKKDRRAKAVNKLLELFKEEIEAAKAAKTPVAEQSAEGDPESMIPQTIDAPVKNENKVPEKNSDSAPVSNELKKMESKLISEIQQLSQDMGDSGSDTIEAISREIDSTSDYLYNAIKKNGENADSATREMGSNVVQVVRAESANLGSRLQADAKKNQEELLKGTKAIQKKVDKIDEICEATEMMEGKLAKLDQLEKIAGILSEKGVEISRDFPPTCEEETDIINLVRYSKKITEQLGYAARELIRKKAHYDSKEQNLANDQAATEKKIADAHRKGVEEGKLSVLKALLSKYADVDTIIESEHNHVHVLWPFMQELNVTVDGDGVYKKGNVFTLCEDDVEKMSAIYKKIDGAGKYRVVKTGLRYASEIIFKAEFEKIVEETAKVEEMLGETPTEGVKEEIISEENGENTQTE